ncbi:hypothetical protein ACHAXN_010978 [Cyclotella atomus]
MAGALHLEEDISMAPLLSTEGFFPRRRRRSRSQRAANLTTTVISITSLLLTTCPSTSAQCNPCAATTSGFAAVPFTGCRQYVTCENSQPSGFNQNCNPGLIFDENIKGCNWDYMVNCPPDPDGETCEPQGEGASNGDGEGETVKEGTLSCDIPLCDEGYSGTAVVPFTNCEQYVSCSNGVAGTPQTCSTGQMYSPQIYACNIASMVVCPPDPTCPPTAEPTSAPTITKEPKSPSPTEDIFDNPSAPIKNQTIIDPESFITPDLLEGIYVMDAHLDANKIMINRELFNGGRPLSSTASTFDYNSFKSSLHTMITTPIDNKSFYIGSSDHANGRVYGLVNIAAFLSQAVVDSIQHGSCDEVNTDLIEGILPISNACGQNSMDYQDRSTLCLASEEAYACNVELEMRATAEVVGASPPPFSCGPAKDYGGFTGYWDFVSETEIKDGPTANALGKTDVQGCCWWGRGVLHTRGICQYGKLNHFLGKKSADEGRPSMFPNVDFCLDPSAVCSNQQYPNMKWITGLFRWVMDIQTYYVEDFYYIDELVRFVDGGFSDWSFIHRVSGIVTQGCHKPPCFDGALFDGGLRKDMFVKTLKIFGLRVNAASESS